MLLMTLRLPVALSVSFADSSPTGGAKSTPVGAGQVVVRQTCSQLRLTRRLPGLTAVRLAPPSGELARRPQGGETERGVWATFPTKSTKSRFHGTPRKARFQRNQRNHDFTAPQRNHESNETHENNEMPLLRAFRFFRCVWRNRDFVATVAPTQKSPSGVGRGCRLTCFCTSLRNTSGSCRW